MPKTLSCLLFLLVSVNLLAQSAKIELCATPKSFFKKIDFYLCGVPDISGLSFGICWSENPTPTLFDAFTIFSTNAEQASFAVSNLKSNTDYYFRIFELAKEGQVTYYKEFRQATLPEIQVGEYHQGGIVVYIFRPSDSTWYLEGEQHGLILCQEDLGFANWGPYGVAVKDSTSVKLGFGKRNTDSITKQFASLKQSTLDNAGSLRIVHPCAAWLCSGFRYGGYDDWFLPSSNEWSMVFKEIEKLTALKLSNTAYYWSSSEVYFNWRLRKKKHKTTTSQLRSAWAIKIHSYQLFSSAMLRKHETARVRAMRYF